MKMAPEPVRDRLVRGILDRIGDARRLRIPFNMSKSAKTTIRILAAPNARGLLHARPSKEVRAQGMPGAGRNPWPACSQKSRRQLPQVQPKTSGIPCAVVLTLMACSPWEPGFLAPIAREIIICTLDTSVGVSGPHDFTSATAAFVERALASTASRLAYRDDRDAPLISKRDGRRITVIPHSGKQKYFCRGRLTAFLRGDPSGKSVAVAMPGATRRLLLRSP
jgi:hypothetical protein